MADTIDGTIHNMRDQNPLDLQDGQVWRSRETTEPKRESIFVWDRSPYTGPLYNSGDPFAQDEIPQYVGFGATVDPDGSSAGVWRWVDPPKGEIDATRVYGISPDASANDNAMGLQRYASEMVQTAEHYDGLGERSRTWTLVLPEGTTKFDTPIHFNLYNDDPTPKVKRAGYARMRGHGPNTILKYVGDTFDAHTFLLGDDE